MRVVATCVLLLCLAAAGCQTPCPEPVLPEFYLPEDGYSSTLLFNRDPGVPPAELYAARSGWPGILSPTLPGDAVLVRERFIDWQGPGLRRQDFTFRRFDSYRVGYRRT